MSQEEGDLPSATPLDLLINAIAGSTDYVYPPPYPDTSPREDDSTAVPPQIGIEGTSKGNQSHTVQVPSNRNKRSLRNESPTSRQKAISKVLSDQIIQSSITSSSSLDHAEEDTTSTRIEVWHPTAGQKSYGKERRIIAPPPKLCISGALLPTISSVTLSTTSASASISSSQTHLIAPSLTEPLPETPSQSPARGKKGEKSDHQRRLIYAARNAGFGATLPKSRGNVEGKDRESLLGDGLNFPGLWIGEDVGKNKEFHLELKVNTEDQRPSSATIKHQEDEPTSILNDTIGGAGEKASVEVEQEQRLEIERPSQDIPIDHSTSLSEVLDPSSMADLQPLAEAVKQVNEAANKTLAEHLPAIHTTTDQSTTENGKLSNVSPDSNNITPTIDIDATIDQLEKATPTPVQAAPPYLTFLSTPLRLVSKPSQKTAKARSMASCFSVTSPFALWTRIHGQTVRTKYMKLEYDPSSSSGQGKLTSKTGKWTPFKFEILRRAVPPTIDRKSKVPNAPPTSMEGDEGNEDILTYGSIVRLVDLQSGIKSDIVKIVKVESGEHRLNEDTDGHPISELQRIGLVRLNDDLSDHTSENGERYHLSAPGARLGGGELVDGRSGRAKPTSNKNKKRPFSTDVPVEGADTLDSLERPVQEQGTPVEGDSAESEPPKKKKKTKRNALAAAVLAEDEDGGSQTVLSWFKARREEQPGGSGHGGEKIVMVEKVEDWMSWIIGGVACSSQTIYKTMIPSSDDPSSRPTTESIDPIPGILVPPSYDPSQNTLDLTLSQFHFPSLSPGSDEPLEIYLGPIGPLFTTCWRSTSHKNTPTAAIPYLPEQGEDEDEEKVVSAWPADKRHVIVRVYLPDKEEIEGVVRELKGRIKEMNGNFIDPQGSTTNQEVASIVEAQEGQLDKVDNTVVVAVDDQLQPVPTATVNSDAQWYDHPTELSHPHPRHDHEDLSIVAALEMSGSLNDLTSFDEPPPPPQTQGAVERGEEGMVIDPSLEFSQPPSEVQPIPIGVDVQTGAEQDTIKLHLPPNQDGRAASKPVALALSLIMVRPSDGVGFGIGKSIAIVGGEVNEEQGHLRIIDD